MKRVLVVVDYQKDFINGALGIKGSEVLAEKIQNHILKFNDVIYTFDTHEKEVYGNSDEGKIFPIHCEYKTEGWNLFNIKPITEGEFPEEPFMRITRERGNVSEHFFCKDKFDIFEGNSLYESFLTRYDKKETIFYVCGVATEYCVKFHVEGLLNRGYKVVVLEDCVKAIDDNIGEETLKGFKMNNEKNVVAEFVDMVQNYYMMTKEERNILIDRMGDFAVDYAEKAGLNGFVLGVSGGLDSAFAAYTLRRAINRRKSNLKLIGLSIPISNTNTHMEQAALVGKETCDSFIEYDAFNGALFDNIMNALNLTDELVTKAGINIQEEVRPVLGGNVKARLRMVIQYDIARKSNCIVLGTENNEENYQKFFTKNGDESCDIIFMNKLYKGTEMWQLAEELNIPQEIIYQAPSDGLGVTTQNTDEAQLGANYKTINAIYVCDEGIMKDEKILDFYNKFIKDTAVCKKIIKRAKDLEYKVNGPVEFQR